MNSRRKGKEGERSLVRKLKEYGYDVRRNSMSVSKWAYEPEKCDGNPFDYNCDKVIKVRSHQAEDGEK